MITTQPRVNINYTLRDRAVVAQLAHNQEVGGASPSPATNFNICAPVAQLVERKAYTFRMPQIRARLSVRIRPGVPISTKTKMTKKDLNKPTYEWIDVNAGEAYYSLYAYCLDNADQLNGHPGIQIGCYHYAISRKMTPKKPFKVHARKMNQGHIWRGWGRSYIKVDRDIQVDNKKRFWPTHNQISIEV